MEYVHFPNKTDECEHAQFAATILLEPITEISLSKCHLQFQHRKQTIPTNMHGTTLWFQMCLRQFARRRNRLESEYKRHVQCWAKLAAKGRPVISNEMATTNSMSVEESMMDGGTSAQTSQAQYTRQMTFGPSCVRWRAQVSMYVLRNPKNFFSNARSFRIVFFFSNRTKIREHQ